MKKKAFSKGMTFRELPFFGHKFLLWLVDAPNELLSRRLLAQQLIDRDG
jgi:hypothetical protein